MTTQSDSPEHLIRKVVTACGSCEDCRDFISQTCLFLPEAFRLHDRVRETRIEPAPQELRYLTDLCNLCGLCPCAKIRAEILAAKVAYAQRDGLPFRVRVLQDVGRIGRLCGAFPRLSSRVLDNSIASSLAKRTLGIHPDRKLPAVPRANFDAWLRHRPASSERALRDCSPKVAYFPGCTARYLFPEVAQAAVETLEAFGAQVVVPAGECCGMPPLLEGDQTMALGLAVANLEWMAENVAAGYDVVFSCPTCGYFFKHLLRDGAYYSQAFQEQAGGDAKWLRIPVGTGINGPREGNMVVLHRGTYGPILQDKGPFAELDPLKRIAVGEHAFDLGEYLGKHLAKLNARGSNLEMPHPVPGRAVYFPPCHLREQKIGSPFLNLLQKVQELVVVPLTGTLDCCGMAGIMGFKKEFHDASLRLGDPLMAKIRSSHPEEILTECLSCRLQFQQLDQIPVRHPVEVLRSAILG